MVGAINLHKGLSPSSQRPCWAHKEKSAFLGAFSSGGRTRYPIRGTYLRPPGYTMPYRQVRCEPDELERCEPDELELILVYTQSNLLMSSELKPVAEEATGSEFHRID